MGDNEMAITLKSMLKIAALLRDRGAFADRQVIPERWILESTKPYCRSAFSELDYGYGYGYGWFLSPSGNALARGYRGANHSGASRPKTCCCNSI
ncbi:hypothetical protein [Ruegeria atlantica]|uniref:hypothetical protein n=1 Tax=Ruegeria atlantica TaxID=81569 RepID=UPI0021BC0B25|nr:hypothetical protein [Ruegeria atlantica]